MRLRTILIALTVLIVLLVGAGAPGAMAAPASDTVTVDGVDLHDGMVQETDGTYFLYGTEYGCGYQWYVASPFCGFGVSTSDSLTGPWSPPRLLFPPSEVDPYSHSTFNSLCGTDSAKGCFNPRMLQRPDGTWVLWFNAVAARTSASNSAYFVMGCNGPAGPCGNGAGAPHGSTHKPTLHQCNGNNGDFAITADSSGAVLICSYGGTLAEEHLDAWWSNGNGTGSKSLAGLSNVEGVGAYQDPDTGQWIMTYSDPGCGYCTGTGTGYATAARLAGPWSAPGNVGWTAPATGRRDISANSCGGQPRTVSVVDGRPYQGIDMWTGNRNETGAGMLLAPLAYSPTPGSPGDGKRWVPPVSYSC